MKHSTKVFLYFLILSGLSVTGFINNIQAQEDPPELLPPLTSAEKSRECLAVVRDLIARDHTVRTAVINTLKEYVPESVQVLRDVLRNNDNQRLRAEVAWVFGQLGLDKAQILDGTMPLPELHDALRDPDGLIRISAKRAFEYLEISDEEEKALWEDLQKKRAEEEKVRMQKLTQKVLFQARILVSLSQIPSNGIIDMEKFLQLPPEEQDVIRAALIKTYNEETQVLSEMQIKLDALKTPSEAAKKLKELIDKFDKLTIKWKKKK